MLWPRHSGGGPAGGVVAGLRVPGQCFEGRESPTLTRLCLRPGLGSRAPGFCSHNRNRPIADTRLPNLESMKLDTFAPGLSGQAALSSVSLSAQRKHARQKATMPRKLTDGDRRLCAKNGREHLQHACTDAFDASSTRRVRGATAPAYTNSKRISTFSLLSVL